jgi:hypothetical protein
MLTVKEIEVNGQKFPVRYDLNALCELEELTGYNMLDGSMQFNMRSLRGLAYVGLKHGHRYQHNNTSQFTKSLDDVGTWLQPSDLKLFPPILFQFTSGDQEKKEQPTSNDKPGE